MKNDAQLQKDVLEQLTWEPFLKASEIGVAVKNGIVTLSGQVDSYSKKLAAERAVKKVAGVRAIAEDIQIGVSPVFRKTDTEIAEAVLQALRWHSSLQEDKIKIKVEDGIVRLEGNLEWNYQRISAGKAIENLAGVRSVLNMITVTPVLTSSDIKSRVDAAFIRSATIDSSRVKPEVFGSRVVLQGKVRSFAEKEDAETAAWNTPGVLSVENNLEIEMPEYVFN